MAQVKFYAVASDATKSDENGIYFVTGGELYKGSQRFGLGRVTVAQSTASIEGAARGDIVVTGSGAGWVYDGTNWQSIGGDVSSLQSMWQADISTWTAGLSAGGEGSYITGITQAADGKVKANASNFANDVKTAVGNGAASSTANGITVSVTTTSGSVTGVEVAAANISATSGTFETLTVTDTATFSATTVSADTLTIGGSTVEQLADKQIAAIAASTVTSTATGITVGVTTQGGSVTAVSLNAESFANAMHFLGVGTVEKTASGVNVTPPAGKTPVAGDIVIDSTSGLEAICTGTDPSTTWELIGDNAVYALNAYSSTAAVYADAGSETVHTALNAAGAAIDALKTKTDAYVGGSASDADQGVSVTVSVDATTLAPSVDVVVTSATLFAGLDATVTSAAKGVEVEVVEEDGKLTSASLSVTAPSTMAFGATGDADELATTAAVKSYFENNLVWLGADGQPVQDGGSTPSRLTIQGHGVSSGDDDWNNNAITVIENGEEKTYTFAQISDGGNAGGISKTIDNVTQITWITDYFTGYSINGNQSQLPYSLTEDVTLVLTDE